MRQHLTCVQSTASICGADVSEISIGSGALDFFPGRIQASHQSFAIGTAGSTTLLMQTILPVLLHAPEGSAVTLQGGTHVIKAPCFEYVDEIFLPQIRRMGAKVNAQLSRAGFFPAGGGMVSLEVEPSVLVPRFWKSAKGDQVISAEVLNTPEIPATVAEKELRKARSALGIQPRGHLGARHFSGSCPGNALLIRAASTDAKGDCPGTLTSAYGERGKRAEQVAKEAIWEMQPVPEFSGADR